MFVKAINIRNIADAVKSLLSHTKSQDIFKNKLILKTSNTGIVIDPSVFHAGSSLLPKNS